MNINNYKQKATGHVTSLANGHVTGSDAHFECEIPTASSNIKIYNFANFGLALLQRRNVSSVRVGLANGTKLGEPTVRAACTPQTVLDRHF